MTKSQYDQLNHGLKSYGIGKKLIGAIPHHESNSVKLSDATNLKEYMDIVMPKPVVLDVRAGDMHRRGYIFKVSDNSVWLTDHVPTEFISVRTLRE